eukprot:403347191
MERNQSLKLEDLISQDNPSKEKYKVEAVVSTNQETGEPMFNGLSRQKIAGFPFFQLNYYQMACKPRLLMDSSNAQNQIENQEELSDEDEEDHINLELFNLIKDTLQCPVCFDIYQSPVIVKPCLHKFCNNCIDAYNRKIKKECPGCRHQIGSRRMLRNDYKISNIISTLISNIDEFNKLEQIKREETVRTSYDFDGQKQKMMKILESQEQIIKQERLEKNMPKPKRKREEFKEHNPVNKDQEQQLKKQIRILDEETMQNIDVEFIICQEYQREGVLKDKVFSAQLIRTTQLVKMVQLKKLIKSKIYPQYQDRFKIDDLHILVYAQSIGNKKPSDDQTIADLMEMKYFDENKVKIFNKTEFQARPNPKTLEKIWVYINV